jgi:hypothetical protein
MTSLSSKNDVSLKNGNGAQRKVSSSLIKSIATRPLRNYRPPVEKRGPVNSIDSITMNCYVTDTSLFTIPVILSLRRRREDPVQ